MGKARLGKLDRKKAIIIVVWASGLPGKIKMHRVGVCFGGGKTELTVT